jgi:hypothetical protein
VIGETATTIDEPSAWLADDPAFDEVGMRGPERQIEQVEDDEGQDVSGRNFENAECRGPHPLVAVNPGNRHLLDLSALEQRLQSRFGVRREPVLCDVEIPQDVTPIELEVVGDVARPRTKQESNQQMKDSQMLFPTEACLCSTSLRLPSCSIGLFNELCRC